MSAPFYNAIKGTTAGTPGTGAFTPNAAATGFRAWSNVPSGWIGLVRYDDGTSWELAYSYWNGTTLSRASTQLLDSSTGSAISLTSAALASMVSDASEIMSHVGGSPWRGWFAVSSSATPTSFAIAAPTATGTAVNRTIASTNLLTEQVTTQITSVTTANGQSAWAAGSNQVFVSTTAGHGGYEFRARFGATTLPTGPRLFVGMTANSFVGSVAEPSALTGSYATFGLDSTDTNIQLLTNGAGGTGTKIDTGIPWAVNGLYDVRVWTDPGATKVYGLLVRMDTGAIWYGSTTTDVPATGVAMQLQVVAGLNGTNTGTAMVLQIGSVTVRDGF